MKAKRSIQKILAVLPALLLAVIVMTNSSALASVSGDATIHNWVSVQYTSGTTTATVYAKVEVKVATVPSTPSFIMPSPSTKTVVAGAFASYSTAFYSTSNGYDTYNVTPNHPTNSGLPTPPPTVNPTGAGSLALWAGIVLSTSGNVVSLPAGSLSSHVSTSTLVYLGGTVYKVNAFYDGIVADTNTSTGSQTPETHATLTLLNLDGSTPGSLPAGGLGVIIGEYKKISVIYSAVGTPTTVGTDGQYVDNLTVASNTDSTKTTTSGNLTTNVVSPSLVISKKYRVLPGTATNPSAPYDISGNTYVTTGPMAKPGDIVEYLITIQNTNTNPLAVANGVTLKDPLPMYTDYVVVSTYAAIGSNTALASVADNGTASKLFDATNGYTLSANIPGGPANDPTTFGYVVFRVKVQ